MKYPVLILNLDYQPFDVWEWQHAITKLICCKNVLPIYDEYGMVKYNKTIRDGSGNIYDLPAVLVLCKYIQCTQLAKYTKYNIYARDLCICQYCGVKTTPKNRTIDHVIPRSLYNKRNCDFLLSSFENVVTCCNKCNVKKDRHTLKQSGMKLLNTPKRITRLQAYQNKLKLLKNKPRQWNNYLYDKEK